MDMVGIRPRCRARLRSGRRRLRKPIAIDSDLDDVVGLEATRRDRVAIDLQAVPASNVFDAVPPSFHADARMNTGNTGVGEI